MTPNALNATGAKDTAAAAEPTAYLAALATHVSCIDSKSDVAEWAELANELAGVGFWRLDIGLNRFVASNSFFVIHGLMRDQPFTVETVLSQIHQQDQDRLRGRMRDAMETSKDFNDNYRVRTDQGVWRTIRCRITCRTEAGGKAPTLRGVVTDITETELFRVLAEKGGDLLVQTDLAGRVTYISPSVKTALGFTPAGLIGIPVSELVGEHSARELEAAVYEGLHSADGRVRRIEYSVQDAAGRDRWLEANPTPMLDPDSGRLIGLTDIIRDVTERKMVESRLELANVILKTQMEVSPHGILLVGAGGSIITLNRRFAEMFGLDPSLADSCQTSDYSSLHSHIVARIENPEAFELQQKYLRDHPEEECQDEIRTLAGRQLSRHSVTLWGSAGAVLGRACFVSDITEDRASLEKAQRMAREDELTGLANRRTFLNSLGAGVAKGRRQGAPFAVLFMDLDHFKDVNDTLGHPMGDEILRRVALRLKEAARETDTVARFGGDEFAIVAGEIKGPAEAAALAERLIRAVGEPFTIQDHVIHSGLSIGIDLFGPGSDDVDALLSHADLALYRAKVAGRGCYRFFTPSMESDARTRVTLAAELHEAIANGELFMLYQPQFSLESGRQTGVEALARWRHPTRGVITADKFIGVAEQMGLMVKLGHWALWTACRQARVWLDAGLDPGRVCVNVSSVQFKTPLALEADIAAALAECALPPEYLELELTETVLMNAAREDNEVLQRLSRQGVGIAIDDFGTGYSSLDYLRRFPVNRIKIAQSFIHRMETSPGDAAIVKATISLARDMGMAVIAEGVETPSHLKTLKNWNCTEAQGFLFAPALSAADIAQSLRAGVTVPV